jgi:hypothetical protein
MVDTLGAVSGVTGVVVAISSVVAQARPTFKPSKRCNREVPIHLLHLWRLAPMSTLSPK